MAREHAPRPDRAAVGPDDLSALATMTQIAEIASSEPASPEPSSVARAADPLPAVGALARVAGAQLHNARLLLSEQNSVGKTRMRFAKRLVLRGSRLFTHRLVGASQDLADAIEIVEVSHGEAIAELARPANHALPGSMRLDDRINRLEMDHSRLDNTLHAQLTSVELGVDDALAAIARASAALNENARGLDVRLSALERSSDHDRSELHRTRTLVQRLVRTVAENGGRSAASRAADGESTSDILDAPPRPAGAAVPAALDDATYVDFEHRFRGSRDEIRARQKDAVPFVTGLVGSLTPVLDLGCGRGEWLELLQELKVSAYGVDSNAAMVAEATRSGLDARLGDALEHLDQLDESSLQGVSAFHFVEHIPLDALVRLLDSALLALRPGGLLLLETPNPTNLIVGAASFYLDPTHLRVLHPDFLSFLVESRGFVDVQVHYVHPVIDDHGLEEGAAAPLKADARLSRVVRTVEFALFGPQDYLLSARRAEVAP